VPDQIFILASLGDHGRLRRHHSGDRFIEKPFTAAQLLTKVAEAWSDETMTVTR
jgi:hypothetical protein